MRARKTDERGMSAVDCTKVNVLVLILHYSKVKIPALG